jgi:S-formylglutathione hydrolase FrmB
MALVSCDFFSEALEVSSSMTVILPQETRTQIGLSGGTDGGLLYLLHGLSDDHTIWQRRTSIERYAAPRGLAVVMPAVHRSFYADEVHGHRYWTFLTEELPALVHSFFRIEAGPRNTYAAGLSMGGYGALKWALREPARFAGVASMSGALDIAALAQESERKDLFARVFGGTPGPSDDLLALLAAADVEALPPMHVSCGTSDHVYPGNQNFVRAAEAAGVDLTVDFRPGEHEWGFWDDEIQTVLDWLPTPGR